MKKLALLFVLSAFVFSGCKKYDDGPWFSLRTKKERLSNAWTIAAAYENGVDKTSDYNSVFADYTLTINKENTYTLSYKLLNITDYTESGSWVFNGDKTHVIFVKTNSSSSSDWEILKLKEKELWGRFYDTSTNPAKEVIVHLAPKF
jgi:hypothetical protein